MAGAADGVTLGSYLADWLAHVQTRVRATTYEGYEVIVRLHVTPHLGGLALGEIRPLDLQHLYSGLLAGRSGRALSSGTVLNVHLVLTQALSQAVRWGLLVSNPAAGAQPPRPRRPEQLVVGPELAARILQAATGSRIELAVALALGTGMRRGEILGLRWADVDLEQSVAHVRRSVQATASGVVFAEPKTRRSRRAVALPRFLLPYLERQRAGQDRRRAYLDEHWHQTDLVIDRGDGAPVHPDTLSSYWRKLVRRLDLPLARFHDLRHAHATLMLSQGVHPKVVSERLGHASVGITLDTYSHVLPSMQTEAARAIDEVFAVQPSA